MLKRNTTIALTCLFVLLAGCVPPPAPQLTPLEKQSLQTREYEHPKAVVFPSVISVFQDSGYTIRSAEINTGLITGDSPTKDTTGFWAAYAGLHLNQQTGATAFIEEIGQITKVRLNFVERSASSSSSGQNTENDTPILDGAIYQNAFEKIESAIFVRSSN